MNYQLENPTTCCKDCDCTESDYTSEAQDTAKCLLNCSQWKETLQNISWTSLAANTLATFCYYATPDLTQNKTLRFFLKSASLATIIGNHLTRSNISGWIPASEADFSELLAELEEPCCAQSADCCTEDCAEDCQNDPQCCGENPECCNTETEAEEQADPLYECGYGENCSPAEFDYEQIMQQARFRSYLALGATAVVAVPAIIFGEKYLYRRAESKRQQGASAPHVKQGLALSLLGAITEVLTHKLK